jgi:Flp pilus assembly protein TadG
MGPTPRSARASWEGVRWNRRVRQSLRYRRHGGDRASVTVEAVLVVPVLMLLLLVVVQFVLWAHAAQVVQLAASEGDRAAQSLNGSPSQGVERARSVLSGNGSDVSSPSVSVSVLAGDVAKITVTGRAESILPGLSLPVSATQVGPVQEFRASE